MKSFLTKKWLLMMVLTFPLVSFGQDYAFVYIAGGSGSTSSVPTTSWTLVGSGSQADFVTGSLNNWTLSSNALTAGTGAAGTYLVRYSLSYSGVATNNWLAGISVNGANPSTIQSQRTVVSSTKDTGTISGSGLVTVSDGQTIRLMVKPANAGTFKPIEAQITLVEVTEASSSYYGGMQISSDQVQTPGTSFTKLSGFTALSDLSGWTVSSNELVAGASAAGTYLVTYSSTFTGIGAVGSPATYTHGLVKNGTSLNPTTMKSIVKANATDRQHTSACGIVSITVGDKISVEVKTANSGKQMTTRYAQVQLYKISGTTAPSVASMYINTDQTLAIGAMSTWYTVGTFTSGTLNEWGFASNTLTPTAGSDAAGMYRLDYSLSFSSPVLDDRYSIAVFVGGAQKLGSTSQRKIRSANYLGTVTGSVLVNISSTTSTIQLKIRKDVGSTGNMTIKKANLALYSLIPGSHDGSLPVELSVWKATSSKGVVKLFWTTDSEIENQGFIIERNQETGDKSQNTWLEIASFSKNPELQGQGSTTSQNNYFFIDKQVKVGKTYSYRLSDVDYRGSITRHAEIDVIVKDTGADLKPSEVKLNKAFPNPFNPDVNLSFTLENPAENLSLAIYDIQGILINTLSSGYHEMGNHEFMWNGNDAHGNAVSSGVYLVRLSAESVVQIQRMTLLR
ncbi:MAG: T9SS type A sorting domain-containing protein [Candidatus Marinimicrobia bacterium]|nr:T9SS type A sorting domain-containing protein [Candidatus Neomarinimicrobiota bacterium]